MLKRRVHLQKKSLLAERDVENMKINQVSNPVATRERSRGSLLLNEQEHETVQTPEYRMLPKPKLQVVHGRNKSADSFKSLQMHTIKRSHDFFATGKESGSSRRKSQRKERSRSNYSLIRLHPFGRLPVSSSRPVAPP